MVNPYATRTSFFKTAEVRLSCYWLRAIDFILRVRELIWPELQTTSRMHEGLLALWINNSSYHNWSHRNFMAPTLTFVKGRIALHSVSYRDLNLINNGYMHNPEYSPPQYLCTPQTFKHSFDLCRIMCPSLTI